MEDKPASRNLHVSFPPYQAGPRIAKKDAQREQTRTAFRTDIMVRAGTAAGTECMRLRKLRHCEKGSGKAMLTGWGIFQYHNCHFASPSMSAPPAVPWGGSDAADPPAKE